MIKIVSDSVKETIQQLLTQSGINILVQYVQGYNRIEHFKVDLQNIPSAILYFKGLRYANRERQNYSLEMTTTYNYQLCLYSYEEDTDNLLELFHNNLPTFSGWSESLELIFQDMALSYISETDRVQRCMFNFTVSYR